MNASTLVHTGYKDVHSPSNGIIHEKTPQRVLNLQGDNGPMRLYNARMKTELVAAAGVLSVTTASAEYTKPVVPSTAALN